MAEKYKREKEEALKKEQEEQLEKERLKLIKLEQDKRQLEVPQKLVKAKRASTPPNGMVQVKSEYITPDIYNDAPFKSNSPPLPAVLKKMREQGKELSVENGPEPPEPMIESDIKSPAINVTHTSKFKQPEETLPVSVGREDSEMNNHMILEQLSAIQRVFNDLRRS